uniref:Regulator of G-protein signaling 8 n=1 Tax=Gopherus agassizii TaxID=38772 RepID=A0A452HEZ9_9SAUR
MYNLSLGISKDPTGVRLSNPFEILPTFLAKHGLKNNTGGGSFNHMRASCNCNLWRTVIEPAVEKPHDQQLNGVAAFRAFLKTEFSEENLEFWLACEEFKKTRSTTKLASKAHRIFEEFIDVQAPREVNIDFQTREVTRNNVQEPSLSCFDQAQGKVHSLMEKDSYPRFLRSKIYTDLLHSQNIKDSGDSPTDGILSAC